MQIGSRVKKSPLRVSTFSTENGTSLNLFNLKCFDLLPLDKKSASHRELFFANQFQFQKTASKFFLCLLDLSWTSSSSFASVATWVEIGRARAWARGPEPKSLTHLKWRKGLTKLKARSFFLDWPKTGLESSSIVKSKLFKLMLSSDYNLGKPQFVLVRSGKRFYWYRLKIIIRLDVQMLFFGSNCQHPDSNLWRLGWESPITTRFQLTCKMQASAKN